jgi:glycerophosphoryl diester phosphodiesterase
MLRTLAAVALLGMSLPAQDVFARLQEAAAEAPLAVGHRGASADYPENTLPALRAARQAGAAVVEFDVYQTKDGHWVCMHDATCDRTTDAVAKFGRKKVRIDEITLAEIRTLDAGSWFDPKFAGAKVPTLQEALDAILPAVPMIERKGGDAKALAAELRRLELTDAVLVQAFDWPWLEELHAAAPELLLGALGSKELTAERQQELRATGARLVHWSHTDLDVEAAAAVRERGQLLCVYTVDADVALLGAAAIGCDLITTNKPGHVVALRQRGLLRRPR